ncbi:MAG: shikimate dehydrogenase [Rhodospirillaceae bacterium]|nr:shikimate dehydrogenase [Rhodospirillaceae bacterium]
MKDQIIKAGVIGWPIDHSLSPRLHGYWLNRFNIKGSYEAIGVDEDSLQLFLEKLPINGYSGLNVTIPHKESVMQHLHSISSQARRIGAVNTIIVNNKGQLAGSNTDGFGFIENLKQGNSEFNATKGPAVVLGAGGAARAIVVALIDKGAPSIKLINRTRARAEELALDIGGPIQVLDWQDRNDILEDASLLVNTTTLGMNGKPPLDISLDGLAAEALVTDIVYAPLETGLLKSARARGNGAVDGLGMLLHQARPGFAAWFGVEPEVTDDLRNYVLAGIGG